jgi:hypothetical protein
MKNNLMKGLALVSASVLGVTGISLAPANASASNKTVIVQESNALSGLNTAVNGKNLLTNSNVLSPTGAGFYYFNNKAQLVRNTAFGTYKITKNTCTAPATAAKATLDAQFGCFKVTYTIKKGLKYSDGTLITGQDLLLSHAIASSDYSIKAGLGDPADGAAFDSAGYGGAYDDHTRANSFDLSDDNFSVTVAYDAFMPDWAIFGPGPGAVHALVGLAKNKKALGSARENASYKSIFEDSYFDSLDTASNFTGLSGDSKVGASVIDFSVAEATKLDLGDKVFGTGLSKNGVTVTEINPEFSATTALTQGGNTFDVADASLFYAGQEVLASYGDDDGDYEYSATVASVNYSTNRVTVRDVLTEEWVSNTATAPYVGTPGHVYSNVEVSVSSPASLGLVAISDNVTATLTSQSSKGASWFAANSLMKSMAARWSKSWNITTVNSATNPLLLVSNGPFMLESCTSSACTLKKNPYAALGGAPKVTGNLENLIFKFTSGTLDDTAVAQAIKAGTVDMYSGGATSAFWSIASAAPGVTTNKGVVLTYEHLDLRSGSSQFPLGSASKPYTITVGGKTVNCDAPYDGPFLGNSQKAKDLRKAYMLIVPRQTIANTYIGKVFDPAFTGTSPTLDSLFSVTSEGDYAKVSAGSSAYLADFKKDQAARVALALALVKKYYANAAPGSNSITVRHLTSSRPLRVANAGVITTEAAKAGIKVEHTVRSTWSAELDCNYFDSAEFAWVMTSLSQTRSNSNYESDGGNNSAGWNDPTLDTLLSQFEKEQTATSLITTKINAEKQLWSNYFSLPMYQWPGAAAWNSDIKNVLPNPLAPEVTWNPWALSY